jgi:hypothetical protein
LKAQVDLFEQGYTILQPLTEHAPFDLVAYKGGRFVRIQVKYRRLDRTGKLEVKFWTSWADRNGTHSVPVDKNEVDVFCVYWLDTDECYYLEPGQFGYSVCLRVKATKNGQSCGVRFASDFRRVP